MKVGYVRVSSIDQNPERQLENIQAEKIFTDKSSGKNTLRPGLEEMINFVRESDEVIVYSMDRLARNLDDLRRIVKELNLKGVKIYFIKESLTFSGDDSPMSTLLLSVMGAFAEFERSLILERQREGIAIAKEKGKYKGRKRALSESQLVEIFEKLEKGVKKTDLAREYNVCRDTIYNLISEKKLQEELCCLSK